MTGTITLSNAASGAVDDEQLTYMDCIQIQFGQSHVISILDNGEKSCSVCIVLIVAGNLPHVLFHHGILHGHHAAQFNDGMIHPLWLTVVIVQSLVWMAVLTIVDSMV